MRLRERVSERVDVTNVSHLMLWCSLALSGDVPHKLLVHQRWNRVSGSRVTGSAILAGSGRVTGQCVRPAV